MNLFSQWALARIFPKAPEWVIEAFIEGAPRVRFAVRQVRREAKRDGDPASVAIEHAAIVVDASLDEAPGFKELTEVERDHLIKGIAVLLKLLSHRK